VEKDRICVRYEGYEGERKAVGIFLKPVAVEMIEGCCIRLTRDPEAASLCLGDLKWFALGCTRTEKKYNQEKGLERTLREVSVLCRIRKAMDMYENLQSLRWRMIFLVMR
jgi:hypothetical protein